ncbi:MAG: flagellar basal body P-ring biosynthesis protein FlgA [Micavibrio sp.]|nr:MAG: flagellar basal body P-ring biosynthesis protein FlgA [Micavibrio sp.]
MNNVKSIWNGWSVALRTLVVTLSLFMGTMLLLTASHSAHAVDLRQNSVITDNTIKLGDVFYGLSGDADKVLGPAPRPGTEMVLNARTLMRIAIALDLPWRPASSADYVVLSRAATLVDREQIENGLKEALIEKGLKGNYNLKFADGNTDIILPQGQPGTIEITSISFDPKKDWFEADIVAPSKNNPIHRARLSGQVERLTSVPVLSDTLHKGTIIGKRDIEFVDLPSRSVNHDYIRNADDLRGMTPRRILHAGKPIQTSEIQAPRIVERGDFVTMIFEDGMLSLTAKGKALENGAKGDFIRVVNTGSNRTVEAVVTAEREVTVQPN